MDVDADGGGGGDAVADNSDGVSDYMVGDYTEGDDDEDEKKRAKRHPRGKKDTSWVVEHRQVTEVGWILTS